jgi:methyl-accepting chemotaxis protein
LWPTGLNLQGGRYAFVICNLCSVLYQSAGSLEVGPRLLPVEYVLGTNQAKDYLRLVCWSDVAQLDDDLERTTSIAVAAVVGLIALAALIVLGIFNRFLFQPVSAMQVEMSRCAEGDLSVRVGRRMLREFSALADAFNVMAKQLAAKVEELNACPADSLTGLANRLLHRMAS